MRASGFLETALGLLAVQHHAGADPGRELVILKPAERSTHLTEGAEEATRTAFSFIEPWSA